MYGPAMGKNVNSQAQHSRDVVDAIREILGLQPLYDKEPDRPVYARSYMHFIGDGNRRKEKSN